MLSQYTRLRTRVEKLGNHHRKYLHTIARHRDTLVQRLEAAEILERVSLWRPSLAVRDDMERVLSVGRDEPERLGFLATYFSLQLLHLNLRSVDVLRLDLTEENRPRPEVYREFLVLVGQEFRRLTAAYMEKLLDTFLPAAERPEFVVLSVGTRSDQEDIDLAVIDDGSERALALHKALRRLVGEMLRNACRLHFYLSEQVGSHRLSASIPEFVRYCQREVQNVVATSEVLGAAPVFGSQALFDDFMQRVARRYYYRPHGSQFMHEVYLRGTIGDMRNQLAQPLGTTSINPKEDALRLLKAALYVGKTIHGVERLLYWDILPELRERDPRRADLYGELEEAVARIEIFRHLYQLYNVQEEDIPLTDEATVTSLDLVAHTLGFEQVGIIPAWQQLMMDYYDAVRTTRRVVTALVGDAHRHLRAISVFRPTLRAAAHDGAAGPGRPSLPAALLRNARRFAGIRYFEDVLADLQTKEGLLDRFVADFDAAPAAQRRRLLQGYAELGNSSFAAVIALLVMLSQRGPEAPFRGLFDALNAAFLARIATFDDAVSRLAYLFRRDPRLVNRYLSELDERDLQRLGALLAGSPLWDDRLQRECDRLAHVCRLHGESSRDLRRRFVRVAEREPEVLPHLREDARLVEVATGLIGRLEQGGSLRERREKLVNYFELEYVRVAQHALGGTEQHRIEREFCEFSDHFIARMFELCKAEVDRGSGEGMPLHDRLAIFVAGGAGREQAFDDDFDLIVLLDATADASFRYANRVVARMSAALGQCGTLPHFRFADVFGAYVTRLVDLDAYFRENPDAFIDKSQVLGAREVVGPGRMSRALEARIITPHIHERATEYIRDLAAELASRHALAAENPDAPFDVKEGRGALRDIETVLLMYKAWHRLREPVNRTLIETLALLDQRHRTEWTTLADDLSFLRRLRDLYRLAWTAEDALRPEGLSRIADLFRAAGDEPSDAVGLQNELVRRATRVTTATATLVADLLAESERPGAEP